MNPKIVRAPGKGSITQASDCPGSRFTLVEGAWVGMDRFGYGLDRSPIKITKLTPLKSGSGHLHISFFHAFYPEGVQDKEINLRVLVRSEHLLTGVDENDCVHVFSALRPGWFAVIGADTPEELVSSPDPAAFLENRYFKA